MRYLSIYLENYIGIYNGMKLNKIYIDFRKCIHNVIVIKGDNGSGKSTLFNAISVLQDDSSNFIPNMSARKTVDIEHEGFLFRVDYIHEFKNGGYSTKGFFYKQVGNEWELCNTNGNVTACKELIFNEFNLDSNFASLSELSSSNHGLGSMIPSVRKQSFNNIVSGVEAYNQIYKTLSKKSSVFKSMINSIVSKINSIGNEQLLISSMAAVCDRISELETNKEELIVQIAKGDNMINLMDPDGSIQDTYEKIKASYSEALTTKKSVMRSYNNITDKNLNIEPTEKFQLYLENAISNFVDEKANKQAEITRLLKENDDDSAKLNAKKAKLASLSSEVNYESLKSMRKDVLQKISDCEAFFTQAGIENTSITSDEYVAGLNTLYEIKEIVDGLREAYSMDIINIAVDYGDGYPDSKSAKEWLDSLTESKNRWEKEYIEYTNLASLASKLKDRPANCNDNECFFIKDAVIAASKNPEEHLIELDQNISNAIDKIAKLQYEIGNMTNITEAINQIKQIRRYINGRYGILSKLPNGYIFSNEQEFLIKLKNGSNFGEISELYKYISYASMFEDYHNAVTRLSEIDNEMKIYAAKNELIEEIISDIDKLEIEISKTLSTIDKNQADINTLDVNILMYGNDLEATKKLIDLKRNLDEADATIEALQKGADTIKETIKKIKECKETNQINTATLNTVKGQISNLEKERDDISYNVKRLEQYKGELQLYSEQYEKVEFIRKCASPTKGIQLIFIEMYLRDIINTANQLLSMVMGGEFRLLKPIIDDRSFNFPCIGDGLPHDDISSLSSGQSALMSVVLSASIIYHSSTGCNVLKLDEVDGQLDTANRSGFIHIVYKIMSILQCPQSIIITHNNELDLRNVDLVILRNSEEDLYTSGANIIFSY